MVRIRSLLIAAALVILLGTVWYAVHWVTNLNPLVNGAGSTAPIGMGVVPHTQDPGDTGPPAYTWQPGGRFVDTIWLMNTASVPITVTGVTHTNNDWVGQFTGPTLGVVPNQSQPSQYTEFHPVRIPAGGERAIAFIFHANPRACGNDAPDTTGSTDSVTVHFNALGVFSDTQSVPLDQMFVLHGPTRTACAT
jgi:hypothetical protein